MSAARPVAWRGLRTCRPAVRVTGPLSRREMVGEVERDPSVAIAERLDADPDHFACGHQRVEHRRLVVATRAGRISRSSTDAVSGAPCSCSIASSSASAPRRIDPMPCHDTRNRPSASVSTGSTCCRSRASDRLRRRRSTSASTHSRSRAARPELAFDEAAGFGQPLQHALRRRQRRGRSGRQTSCALNGPCDRANRSTRSPAGSRTGSSSASGSPGGSGVPSASRYRATSSTAT